jgi:4-hydroxy-tetrahydrodipicolinate synthase
MQRFTGVITALVTPFRDGNVAYDEFAALVRGQIAAGIDAVVPVGTTGESPTLDHDEHLEVIRAAVAAAAGKVPVIAGTGSNSTLEAVDLTRRAHQAGAAAMLVVAPYYNKPSQEGLFRHYAQIAEATDRPIILYSIPGRCGIEIGVGVVERLLKAYPHVNHIKEAGGSCDRVDLLKQAMGDQLCVLSGDDSLTLPFMAIGAEGVVSVASNLLPKQVKEMVTLARNNQFAEAGRLHRRLYPVFKTLFIEPNPVPVKAAMLRAGLIGSEEVRSPLCPMTAGNRETLLAALQTLEA